MAEDHEIDAVRERLLKIKKDPWEFFKVVKTLDQVDRVKPIKAYPTDLKYLELVVRMFHKVPLLAIPKSRRMKLSWTTIGCYTWDTCFRVGVHNAFVSKKEDDSDELVRRAHFIMQNLDNSGIPRELLPRFEYTFNKLRFPELESVIQGFPSGADQLRQYTFSGMFFDELSFWDDPEKTYASSFPTLEGGGRCTAVSSPAPGFFKRLVYDQIDQRGEDSAEVMHDKKVFFPMQGVKVWKNPKNKFTVLELHYSADPAKRGDSWKTAVKSSMPLRQYNQEYELAWESWAGLPVYDSFNETLHGVQDKIDPHIGLPLLRGWDFGLTPAAAICQLQEEKLVVLYEFTAVNMGAERFSELVLQQCARLWPTWADKKRDWVDFIDPSGAARKDTDEGSCAKILDGKGLAVIGGPIPFEERKGAVEYFLTRRNKDGMLFEISLAHCPTLVRGFKGGYQYPETAIEIQQTKLRPIKNEFSHIHDALQMVAGSIRKPRRRRKATAPAPSYSFSQGAEQKEGRVY